MIRAIILILSLTVVPVSARAETRCGWFANPTPANYVLTDRHDSWWLSVQGRGGVPGFHDALDRADSPGEWVAVNGSYGYGCACVEGDFGLIGSGDVKNIRDYRPLPLVRCFEDPDLPPGPFGD